MKRRAGQIVQGLFRRLDGHWFEPAPLRHLAIVRVVVVGLQLSYMLFNLRGCNCQLDYQILLSGTDPEHFRPIPALKVLLLPFGEWGLRPEPMFLHAVWLAGVVTGIAGVLGLFTNLSILLFAAANTLLIAHAYSYTEYHHPEAILIIFLWILAFSPAGRAWSLDRLRDRLSSARDMFFRPHGGADRSSPFARWPLRTGQWLLVLAYLSAALSKLEIAKGQWGLDWASGHTLAFQMLRDYVAKGHEAALWMAEAPIWLLSLLSYGALLFELTFAVAILIPAAAWAYVIMGTGFHMGIYITQGAPFFQFIGLYVVFVGSLARPLSLIRPARKRPSRWSVVYDGLCPVCLRTMILLDTLDLRRRLSFVDFESSARDEIPGGVGPEEARLALHVVDPNGTVHRGFFAFRALARLLPPLWPLFPLVHAPGASRLGPKVYGWIAAKRSRRGCHLRFRCAAGDDDRSSDDLPNDQSTRLTLSSTDIPQSWS